MYIDTHMHCIEGSDDSFIKVSEIVRQAKIMGLDAICITDHDSLRAKEYALKYGMENNFKIFVGVEILTYEGDVIVFGLDKVPEEKIHAQELIDLVNLKGGVAICAHPFRDNNRGCGNNIWDFKGLHGIETFNGSTKPHHNLYAFALAIELGLATLAASDCHETKSVGRYCTIFPDWVETEDDFIRAIKEKQVHPAVFIDGKYEKINAYGKYGQAL